MHRSLIIETSPIIRRVARAILLDFGFEVLEAATGREGIAVFQRFAPRLVIVDANLTDVPALDVLRHIKNSRIGDVQAIYCTTDFDVVELQRPYAAGATDVLIKPFDRSSLAAKLDAWPQGAPDQKRENFYSRLSRSEIVRIA
jgi:two-component system chemotaxis response regulator CheY